MCTTYEAQSRTLSTLSAKGTLAVFSLPPVDSSEDTQLSATLVRHLAMYMPSDGPNKARSGRREKDGPTQPAPRVAMFAFDSAYVALVGETPDQKCMSRWAASSA